MKTNKVKNKTVSKICEIVFKM